MKKPILDACCGGKHFWIDKKNPNVLFMDIRKEKKGYIKEQPNFEINPDLIGDFRKTNFRNNQFKHIVWDIPHKIKEDKGIITKKYGYLGENWKEDLTKGFNEIWRILDTYGTLCMKFSDFDIKMNDILNLFSEKALYGTITKKGVNNSYWFVFMKIPKEISRWKNSVDLTPDFISRKTNKEIEQRWYKEMSNWNKLSQKHANSKDSKYRGYVTEEEHLTGERESNCEGWIEALEWVIGMSFEDAEKIEEKLK